MANLRSLKPDWKTHAALLVVQVAFASQAVEGKLAMLPREAGGGGVHPVALAMTRMAGAAVVFQLVWRAVAKDAPGGRERLSRRDHLILVGLSMLGIVLNQTLFLLGLRVTTSFSAALLGCTIPVLTAALAAMLGQERLTVRMAAGLALAICGVLWLTGIGRVDVGAAIVAVNCLSYSAYIVLSRSTILRLGALRMMAWVFTWGAIVFAPVGMFVLARDASGWNARSVLLVAYIVAVPTVVAYLANAWALGRSSASLVTVYIYTQPLIAALLQWVQLSQPVTQRMLVASGLICGGVALVATRRVSAAPRKNPGEAR